MTGLPFNLEAHRRARDAGRVAGLASGLVRRPTPRLWRPRPSLWQPRPNALAARRPMYTGAESGVRRPAYNLDRTPAAVDSAQPCCYLQAYTCTTIPQLVELSAREDRIIAAWGAKRTFSLDGACYFFGGPRRECPIGEELQPADLDSFDSCALCWDAVLPPGLSPCCIPFGQSFEIHWIAPEICLPLGSCVNPSEDYSVRMTSYPPMGGVFTSPAMPFSGSHVVFSGIGDYGRISTGVNDCTNEVSRYARLTQTLIIAGFDNGDETFCITGGSFLGSLDIFDLTGTTFFGGSDLWRYDFECDSELNILRPVPVPGSDPLRWNYVTCDLITGPGGNGIADGGYIMGIYEAGA